MAAPVRIDGEVVATVPARVHLAGNPSDGYGGAVLSTVVPAMAAVVRAVPAARFSVAGPLRAWGSLDELAEDCARTGHEGGDRLVTAALAALHRLLPTELDRPPLSLAWSTTIPRSVGLGGSSAVVVAAMQAALACWGLDVPAHELAEAALVAETEDLAIAAGLADRVVQVAGRTVLTDCRDEVVAVSSVTAARPLEALLLWSPGAAAPSGGYHGALRARLAEGGDAAAEIAEGMATLATIATDAAAALAGGDRAGLASCLDASLDVRLALGEVPEAPLAPVAGLRAAGASVNFAGSGGALVVLPGSPGAWPDVPEGWSARRITLT